jgi:hypothetical protein
MTTVLGLIKRRPANADIFSPVIKELGFDEMNCAVGLSRTKGDNREKYLLISRLELAELAIDMPDDD